MLEDYREMMIKLGEPGASKRAAEVMVEKLGITLNIANSPYLK